MSNGRRIPDAETRARSVAKLRDLVERMDRHIADLDGLNARLEADFQNSLIGAYYRRRAERLAAQKQELNSPPKTTTNLDCQR